MNAHASPTEMRARAKSELAKWRELLPVDPTAAREHLANASNLAMLAAEADEHTKNVTLARQGE